LEDAVDYSKLEPVGNKLVVRRDACATSSGDLDLPIVAVTKRPCKHCNPPKRVVWLESHQRYVATATGCFVYPVFEEDGIKVAKFVEITCTKCGGRGYREATYDPRVRDRSRIATVISVGPGRQKAKRQ
jgi:hypothetical protein